MNVRKFIPVLCGAFLIFSGATAWGATIDLRTQGSSTTLNDGALLSTAGVNTGAGSGVIDAFLRTQKNVSESGYNTDGALNEDQVGGCCTHSITLGELLVVDVSGTDYYLLKLDVNEPNNTNSEITMQELQLWVNTTTGADDDYSDGLGNLVWDMVPDTIQMDNGVGGMAGSGDYDYDLLVPTALFAAFDGDDYLYLYNTFGDTDGMSLPSEAGFEEWAAVVGGNPVPLPAAAWLFISGLGALGVLRRQQAA